MRRLLAVFLSMIMTLQAFPLMASADYVIGNSQRGEILSPDAQFQQTVPFEVEITERSNRYALDVVYDTLSIDVDSAIWDVNDHVYAVTMSEDLSFSVTLINHSNQPVYVRIIPTSDIPGISFLQDPIFGNRVTIPAAVPVAPAAEASTYAIGDVHSAAGYITSEITAYSENWQSVVNQIIMSDQIQNGEYTVGNLRIEFSRE